MITMSGLLKGNFQVKRPVTHVEQHDAEADFKAEFKKKALESIGGSMVFVEREKLFWDGTDADTDK
jgi:hypothetical protein